MAAAPVFIADLATLKSQLRLTGMAQPDAEAIVESCVERVRINLYDRLSVVRVNQILAITYAQNPATEDQILRAKANAVELAWIKAILYRDMPISFLDASGDLQQKWNEEGFSRHLSLADRDREVGRLMAEVEQGIAGLKTGSADIAAGEQVQISSIEPHHKPRRIAADIGLYVPAEPLDERPRNDRHNWGDGIPSIPCR